MKRRLEGAGDAEPGERERLLQALAQRGGGAGMRALELAGERLERGERPAVVGLGPGGAELAPDRRLLALGQVVTDVSLLVADTALDGCALAEHVADRLAQGFGAVDTDEDARADVEAALDEVGEERGRDRRVLARALPEAERDLDAVVADAERDDVHRPLELDPVDHQNGQAHVVEATAHQLLERGPRPLDEASRDRRLRGRAGLRLDLAPDRLLRPCVAAAGDAGEHPLEDDAGEGILVGEVAVGAQLDLPRAVLRADARALDGEPPPTERDLALLVPVAVGPALRHVFALRADGLAHLLLHQLGEDAEADADREGEQPLLGRAGDLVEGDLDTLGQG